MRQGAFDLYRCGICARESWSHDEITRCLRSHTKDELALVYRTGGYTSPDDRR